MSKTEQQINQTIADWLGDIVALETHVEEAMDRQLSLQSSSADLTSAIKRFHDTVRDNKQRAVAYQKEYGSTAGNPVIKAGTNLLGKAAGMIDKMRNDAVSKALRDDYTAYNHVSIAYTMLHTTAMALGDTATQRFAEAGLRSYTGMVMDIVHLIPEAVVLDLKDSEGAQVVNEQVVDECRRTVEGIWREAGQAQQQSQA
jgi:ferritin-like metal-binding protein YciE